jgi:Clp amino terminal domain, pathogenicity island component
MFERFTDRARRAVVLAQDEAAYLNHDYIGTEHILLGLLHEGEGIAGQALGSLGLTLEAARGRIEQTTGRGEQPRSGHVPFTPRAKNVLELSLREALRLNHNYIGTGHMLLGLLREGQGLATVTLVQLGFDPDAVRERTLELLASEAAQESEPMPVHPATARVPAPGTLPAPGLPPYGSTERPRLDRVVPLAREVELPGGTRLVLLSLEVWSTWMTLRSGAFAEPGEAIVEPVARFQLTDAAGTAYQCTSTTGGGSGWFRYYHAVFQPGPPDGTSGLTLTASAADGAELAVVEIDLGGGVAAQAG